MSKNEPLSVNTDSNYSDTGCDESKCVSHGLSVGSLACYYNDWNAMACSHGYRPHRVNSESAVLSEDSKWGDLKFPSMLSHYFTCCPPDLPPTTNVTRDCSNPIRVINSNTTDICDDDMTRPYPRKMANIGPTLFSVCCSTLVDDSNNETASFLNETECVPFQNVSYNPAIIENTYGQIVPVGCNNDGIYKLFQYPREVVTDNDNHDGIFQFECCKTESTNKLPPFVRDSTFMKSIYPQIVLSSTAVFSLLFR